jgi:hypothetical protein
LEASVVAVADRDHPHPGLLHKTGQVGASAESEHLPVGRDRFLHDADPAQDPSRLRAGLYHTDANLCARVGLHQRFSTSPNGWYRWMFDQLDRPTDARLLEVGCGTGGLSATNTGRVPAGWRLVLSDLSAGLLRVALDQVRVPGVAADVAALPCPMGVWTW